MTVSTPSCRACHAPLGDPGLDLGLQPVLDEPVTAEIAGLIPLAPVRLRACRSCSLAQLDPAAIDRSNAPPSLASALDSPRHGHGRRRPGGMSDHIAGWAAGILAQTDLRPGALVVDIASGDGALLEPFMAAGMAVLGHELRWDLAAAANADGIRTIRMPSDPQRRRPSWPRRAARISPSSSTHWRTSTTSKD